MKLKKSLAVIALCLLAAWQVTAAPSPADVMASAPAQTEKPAPAPRADAIPLGECLAWQIALEREGFSPGLIDGKIGPKTLLALREFRQARGLAASDELDADAAAALNVPSAGYTLPYTITPEDAAQVTGWPQDWLERSRMARMGYATMADMAAEKFHCSQGLLARLNEGVDFAKVKAGDALTVPAIEAPKCPRVESLRVNLTEKVIRCFDKEGKLVALFHCSIARDKEKRPAGAALVVTVIRDPDYTFDPALWPEVKEPQSKLIIPPGPRNPVGLCWIALNLPGYGMHGTPTPEMIGKTGSHGCFRLTNWDAVRLGKMLRAGVPVEFDQ